MTLSRKSPLRRTGIARGTKKRSRAEQDRVYGPKAFRDWLHQQPCAVSGVRGHIEQAHAKSGGMGRKEDWTLTFPIAAALHRRLHQQGVKTFEADWGVTLVALAAKTQERWRCR